MKMSGEMRWVRIWDKGQLPEALCWVPALFIDGVIMSPVGALLDSGNPEDVRDMEDCPIPGWEMIKKEI